MARKRGRPPKSDPLLTREAILAAVQVRLERPGGALSMRGLAADLGVTPMALYGHIEGIDGLLDVLAGQCLGADTMPEESAGLPALLDWYCARVLDQPGLTGAIVARRGALPAPHRDWTERLTRCLAKQGLPPGWRDVLVDHLHGFALSQAAGGADRDAALALYGHQRALLVAAILAPDTPA